MPEWIGTINGRILVPNAISVIFLFELDMNRILVVVGDRVGKSVGNNMG